MTPLLIAILTTINKIIDLYGTMIEKASPEDQQKLLKVIAEREAWWQQNIWRKIGDFLDGDE
jgi:hypothetical protein